MTQIVRGLQWGCTHTPSPGLTPLAWGLDALYSARAPEDGSSLPPPAGVSGALDKLSPGPQRQTLPAWGWLTPAPRANPQPLPLTLGSATSRWQPHSGAFIPRKLASTTHLGIPTSESQLLNIYQHISRDGVSGRPSG